jgi:hypothetical protein
LTRGAIIERADSQNSSTFATLNPRGMEKDVPPVPLAPRIPDLKDKTIYCVSQFVGGADGFLQKIADRLPGYAPGVKTVFKHKESTYMSDDRPLWDEIQKEADAVIYGCGA